MGILIALKYFTPRGERQQKINECLRVRSSVLVIRQLTRPSRHVPAISIINAAQQSDRYGLYPPSHEEAIKKASGDLVRDGVRMARHRLIEVLIR